MLKLQDHSEALYHFNIKIFNTQMLKLQDHQKVMQKFIKTKKGIIQGCPLQTAVSRDSRRRRELCSMSVK